MKNIAFYISNHGFGHASRNIPIIRYILDATSNIKIYIKTDFPQGEFIKSFFYDEKYNDRIFFYFEKVDLGLILKEGSMEIDSKKLEKEVLKFIYSWKDKIERENKFLKHNNIDMIISDIVPWIFKVKEQLNIRSILISNFTWVDIYEEHLSKEICDKFLECYKLSDKIFIYDLYINNMIEKFNDFENVGLVCREFNNKNIIEIKNKYEKEIVFVSVGRSVEIDRSIDVSKLDYQFIVTEGIKLVGDNVKYLSKEVNDTQDYIKASKYVITKAGWSTISECILSKSIFAVLSRDNVSEDREVIKKLDNKEIALKIDSTNLDFIKIISELEQFKPNYSENSLKNNYMEIGKKIIRFLMKEGN